MEAFDELVKVLASINVLANVVLIAIGLETLRHRDRITRVEASLESVIRELTKGGKDAAKS